MIIECMLLMACLPLIEQTIYIFNSEDGSPVQFYDCIVQNDLSYCRRPTYLINLERDQEVWDCFHNGTRHSFRVLEQHNISVSTVLREWKSSVEMAEEYAYYLRLQQEKTFVNGDEKFLCQCTHAQSFGKHCEYRLAMHTTFEETLDWQLKMRIDYSWQMQLYGDIVCYKTLNCDSGLLCLDWRDICDGVQHCMFGYDEENCDKLEFNACEGDEYRCLNAMCIPDQYFLDGNYDCMDMSDEKGKVNDENCIFREASHECDDRVCLRRYWSCGDGQCIRDWTQFKIIGSRFECASLRDQYYMRETQSGRKQWTLPNGRCFHSLLYVEDIRQNHSILEQCVYLLKCALSKGAEKNCPCESNSSCTYQLITHCNSTKIQYPIGAIFAPYASSFYNIPNDQLGQISDSVLLNGTIKCRGYMAESLALKGLDLSLNMEYRICSEGLSSSANKVGYDRSCHNGSRTFNNRSYHFIDVCHESRECISAYRINDVYPNCARGGDEERIDLAWKSCSDVEGHRLRCSNEQPLCLPVFLLGQQGPQCKNSHDEFWMGQGRPLSALACNKQSKDDCQLIRQYIERSSKMDTNLENSTKLAFVDKVPFRWFCDTFWQMNSRKDEDVGMCQEYWTCAEDQWRCDTGQCVKAEWVLDGEWDCSDASDEEAIFFSRNTFSTRNLKVRNETFLRDRFHRRYRTQPFNDICNLSTEYPCFRVDAFDALNTTHYRPCINLTQIGDGHVDCIGALDERNNRQHCNRFSMLGYYFECPGDNHCVFYDYHCARGCNDSRIQCYGYKKTPDCSDSSDFMCLNGTCARRGWCNQRADCSLGEDEYLCILLRSSLSRSDLVYYRESKRLRLEEKQTVLLLPAVFLRETQKRIVDTTRLSSHVITNYFRLENYPSSSPFWCNRGVGALLINGSIVCFCPPQYYGDKCQYHSDRLTVLVRLNLSQSTYDGSTNPKTLLKLLIILLHENKSVMIESVPIHLSTETTLIKKTIHYLLYSRSPDSLMKKRTRYFNRSMIIDHHPYSVRIEVYELQVNDEKPRLEGVWLYPIYFDFLPNFRLAKVLYLTRLSDSRDPCLSSPCTVHQECHRLLNEPSHFVCLCPPKFSGKECSIQDRLCQDNFCGSNALCKPNYRGLVRGNDRLPYCLCPLSRLGDRCQLKYDLCDRNPCLNNGICLPTSQLNSYFCLCTEEYYGNKCHLKKHSVHLRISENLDDRVALVQYFDINFVTLELILVHQHLYDSLPQSLFYLHEQTKKAPAVIVVKLYSNTKIDTYVISLQIEVEWIEGTTELSERNRCAYVDTLLPIQKGAFIKKHRYTDSYIIVFRDISHPIPLSLSTEP